MSSCGPLGLVSKFIAYTTWDLLFGFFSLLHRLALFHIPPGKCGHLDLSTMPKAGGSIGCVTNYSIPSTKGISKVTWINVNKILKQGLPNSLHVLIRQGKPQQGAKPQPLSQLPTRQPRDSELLILIHTKVTEASLWQHKDIPSKGI